MTSAQVVETSVNVNNNSSFQNYTNPDDHTLDRLLILLGSNRLQYLLNSLINYWPVNLYTSPALTVLFYMQFKMMFSFLVKIGVHV